MTKYLLVREDRELNQVFQNLQQAQQAEKLVPRGESCGIVILNYSQNPEGPTDYMAIGFNSDPNGVTLLEVIF